MRCLLIALVFAFVSSACVDTSSRRHAVPSSRPVGCRQFASCGACTPILGCGWCTIGNGGMCVDDPNDCAAATSFQWTWDKSGCPAAADGGMAADAAPDVESTADAGTDVGVNVPEGSDGDTDADAPEATDAVAVD